MKFSNTELFVFIAVGIVGLLVLAAVLGAVADRRYRKRLSEWAAAQGWAYQVGGGGPWTQQLEQGIERRVVLQLEGARRGRHLLVAHWWCKIRESPSEWGTESEVDVLMVVVLPLPVRYPDVRVKRRGAAARLARSAGRKPAAPGHEAFDRGFQVRCNDPAAGRRLLTQKLMNAHLAGVMPPLWRVNGRFLVGIWHGKVKPSTILPRVDQLLDLAKLLGT
ncbi:hypothetical protein ABZ883_34520 [Streptomyces sp. NPDC046977]|uniref:hypothetical protein n=1 Tax=Streptomyces sp. NPDC046977 TaxID=3154703 RepID=UPI0034091226